MIRAGILRFEGGWGGGNWFIDKTPVHKIKEELFVKFGNKFYKLIPVVISGTDYDHGHTYEWTGTDYIINVNTELGFKTKLSLKKEKLLPCEAYVEK